MTWSPGVTIEDLEKEAVIKAFRFYNQNKTHTANSLGIAIRTLDSKLEQYGIIKTEETTVPTTAGTDKTNEQNDDKAETRLSIQPAIENTKEHALPMSEQKEVQGLPFKQIAKNSRKRKSG